MEGWRESAERLASRVERSVPAAMKPRPPVIIYQ